MKLIKKQELQAVRIFESSVQPMLIFLGTDAIVCAALFFFYRFQRKNAQFNDSVKGKIIRFFSYISLIIVNALAMGVLLTESDGFDGEGLVTLLLLPYWAIAVPISILVEFWFFFSVVLGSKTESKTFPTLLAVALSLFGATPFLMMLFSEPVYAAIIAAAKISAGGTSIYYLNSGQKSNDEH